MTHLAEAMAAADAMFADEPILAMQAPDERYGYKKASGDADAPKTQDNFN